jgi:hypothetical protein
MAVITKSHDWITGETITEALLDAIEDNIIDNGLIPAGIEDYSATDAQMQTQTDPYPGSVISKATALAGELERIRYQIAQIMGETYWYLDPDDSIADIKSDLDSHDHDSVGGQVVTAGLADGAVTNDKLGADAVDGAKIGDDVIDSEHYVAGSIDNEHLAANSVDSDQYVDGSIDRVHLAADIIDGTKIEDDAVDSEHFAAGSIDEEHLSTAVRNLMSPKSIQVSSGSVTMTGTVGSGSNNVTITSVDTSKAYVILNGVKMTSENLSGAAGLSGWARLTSATNVEIGVTLAEAAVSGTGTFTVYFTVVEWN